MKTNKLWFAMAAAAVVTVMSVFTSCSKDDEPYLPEVIESEVLETGISNDVNEISGTEGTQLSYESWIVVKGQTRAAFENKVSVTLNNQLNNVDTTIVVSSYKFKEMTTSVSYKERSKHIDGFITVTDSVLVYRVSYGGFSFDYNLIYQVPVYDDGFTKQTMPYHRYSKITDKGGEFVDMESIVDGNYAYFRRLYRHTINVECNGKNYDITANVILMCEQGSADQPFIVKSEMTAAGASSLNDEVYSFVCVKQTWSDGSVVEKRHNVQLGAYVENSVFDYQTIFNYKKDLKIIDSALEDGSTEIRSEENEYVMAYRTEQFWKIEYNYFSIQMKLVHDEAYYDDGVLSCKFPGFEFTEIVNAEPELTYENSGNDDNGTYDVYWLKQGVSAQVDQLKVSGYGTVQIVAYR